MIIKTKLILLLTGLTIKTYCQQPGNTDSAWMNFSDKLRATINSDLQNVSIDTINFTGVYMFKFRVADNSAKNFYCSKGTPQKLCTVVKDAVEKSLSKQSQLQYKTFLLPVIVDYEGNTKKGMNKEITITDILKLMIFEDTPSGKKQDPFIYSGVPVDGIQLPPFFYQSYHYSRISLEKYKKE